MQNWAEVLERDIRVLEEAVAMGEGETLGWEGEDEGFESGGGEDEEGAGEDGGDNGGQTTTGGAGGGKEQKALEGRNDGEATRAADKVATTTENR